jgi:hypothetical protein
MSNNPRLWNTMFGIFILVNGVITLLYLIFSSSLILKIWDYGDIAVWGNYPEYFANYVNNPIFGLIFQIANVIMLILIIIFGGLMKSHYKVTKLDRYWRKMIMAAILSFFLLIFNFFYDTISTKIYYARIVDLAVTWGWNIPTVNYVYFQIFEGAWATINGLIGIFLAANYLWAWFNFRSFAKEHLDKPTSIGALVTALGSIPQILGILLQIGVFALNIDWILYQVDDGLLDWAVLPITDIIGEDGFVTLNLLSAFLVIGLPYLFSISGYIIIGIRFMVANKPHHSPTNEPTLENYHTSSTQPPKQKQADRPIRQVQQGNEQVCNNCGNKLPPHLSFCPFCGTALR